MPAPRTIHDFGGFPAELYRVTYPAPGDPALAKRVQSLLSPIPVSLDQKWGLDHGAWSVLCHVFPNADIPVLQLSIDETQTARVHYEMAKQLAPLRDEEVLVISSGNLVHNLHAYAGDVIKSSRTIGPLGSRRARGSCFWPATTRRSSLMRP